MARKQFVFSLVAFLMVLSACEKAKMKTVAPSDAPAAQSATPPVDAEQDQTLEEEEPADVDTSEAKGPAVLPLEDDGEDFVDSDTDSDSDSGSVQNQEIIGDTDVDQSEQNLPGDGDVIPTPTSRPQKTVIAKGLTKQNCPECCDSQGRVVRNRPVARDRVVVREQAPIRQRQIIFSEASLHCRWEPQGKPIVYLRFDNSSRTAWVKSGWPAQWAQYKNVTLVSGLGPYGDDGFSLMSQRGLRIASVRENSRAALWNDSRETYPYEAKFGEVEGRPRRETLGVCWSKDEPSKRNDNH